MNKTYLSGAMRTPIGAFGGAFTQISAVELASVSACASLERAGITPDKVDETIFGNVLQAGQGQNPARQIAMKTGVPETAPAFTVNKVCGSGLKAVELAWQCIALGKADIVLAGGAENMNMAPYLLPAMRKGARLGDSTVVDSLLSDGLTDIFSMQHMGITAENIASKYAISRAEQDAFAADSQRKCGAAMRGMVFNTEIIPVTVKNKRTEIVVDKDEHPRPDTTSESLSKLTPAFKKDGTVTPGNSSGINDGAASVIVFSEKSGMDRSNAMLIRDFAACGCPPALMGLGPVYAVNKLLKNNGLQTSDIDLWELNEAFAAQSIAVLRELKIDPKKCNVNGGAIALGHPIGASGCRILGTLIHEMKKRRLALGVAALCIGGGMGMATLVENI